MDYLNTVATIKTTNMLYKCPECERLICGYEPIIHRKFCFKTILTTPINERTLGTTTSQNQEYTSAGRSPKEV